MYFSNKQKINVRTYFWCEIAPDPWEDFYYVNDASGPSYTKELIFALCDAFFRNPSALNFENKIQWIKKRHTEDFSNEIK